MPKFDEVHVNVSDHSNPVIATKPARFAVIVFRPSKAARTGVGLSYSPCGAVVKDGKTVRWVKTVTKPDTIIIAVESHGHNYEVVNKPSGVLLGVRDDGGVSSSYPPSKVMC